MQDQLPVARELEVARFASVVACWRSARASMFSEQLVCVEILLTVAAPEFRWPAWIVEVEPVCAEECVAVERPLTRDAVQTFGYEQIDMGLHSLVSLQRLFLVKLYATWPASTNRPRDIRRGFGPDRIVHPFAAHMMSEEFLFALKPYFATSAIQVRAGRRSYPDRAGLAEHCLVETLVSLYCTQIRKEQNTGAGRAKALS